MKAKILSTCVMTALVSLSAIQLHAAVDYPKKAIEIYVPAAAGGGTDLGARTFAKYAQKKFGKPVVIVNVKGAGGYNGSKMVHEANPDGYKVLYFHNSLVSNYLTRTAPYSYDGFDTGPAMVEDGSMAFFTQGKSGIKNAKDLIEKAKANPGKLKAATEYGATSYYLLLKFQKDTGVKFNLVDVGGDSEKVTALLGGFIDIMPKVTAGTQAYIDNGDFNVLGVPSEKRTPNAPQVPTYTEQGVSFTYPPFLYGFHFTKGTPKEIRERFTQVAKEVAADPAYIKDMEKIGLPVRYTTPEDSAKFFAKMQADFAELSKTAAEVKKESK